MFEKLEKGLRVFNHFSILTGIEKIGKNEVGVVESKLYNTGQIVDSTFKSIAVHFTLLLIFIKSVLKSYIYYVVHLRKQVICSISACVLTI